MRKIVREPGFLGFLRLILSTLSCSKAVEAPLAVGARGGEDQWLEKS